MNARLRPEVADYRYVFEIAAPMVYLGSTKFPSLTLPHWLSIM